MFRNAALLRTPLGHSLLIVSALLTVGLSGRCTDAADAGRPNILFILVDDQSPFDLKAYNAATPVRYFLMRNGAR